ncbi:MAG: hypothetical protein ABIT92_00180 [Gammaproteobacteria bacterium]
MRNYAAPVAEFKVVAADRAANFCLGSTTASKKIVGSPGEGIENLRQ